MHGDPSGESGFDWLGRNSLSIGLCPSNRHFLRVVPRSSRSPPSARKGTEIRVANVMNTLRLLHQVLLQMRPYWLHLAGVFLLGLLATPIALLLPLPLKFVVDSVLGDHPLPGFLA